MSFVFIQDRSKLSSDWHLSHPPDYRLPLLLLGLGEITETVPTLSSQRQVGNGQRFCVLCDPVRHKQLETELNE